MNKNGLWLKYLENSDVGPRYLLVGVASMRPLEVTLNATDHIDYSRKPTEQLTLNVELGSTGNSTGTPMLLGDHYLGNNGSGFDLRSLRLLAVPGVYTIVATLKDSSESQPVWHNYFSLSAFFH